MSEPSRPIRFSVTIYDAPGGRPGAARFDVCCDHCGWDAADVTGEDNRAPNVVIAAIMLQHRAEHLK